jgi:hypothetical protein
LACGSCLSFTLVCYLCTLEPLFHLLPEWWLPFLFLASCSRLWNASVHLCSATTLFI